MLPSSGSMSTLEIDTPGLVSRRPVRGRSPGSPAGRPVSAATRLFGTANLHRHIFLSILRQNYIDSVVRVDWLVARIEQVMQRGSSSLRIVRSSLR